MRKLVVLIAFACAASLGSAFADDNYSEHLYAPGTEPEIESSGCEYSRMPVLVDGEYEWRILETCS